MSEPVEAARDVTDLIGIARAITGQDDERTLNLLIAAAATHAQATGQAGKVIPKTMWAIAAVRPHKLAPA